MMDKLPCDISGSPWWASILLNIGVLLLNFYQNMKMAEMGDHYLKVRKSLQQAMDELGKPK